MKQISQGFCVIFFVMFGLSNHAGAAPTVDPCNSNIDCLQMVVDGIDSEAGLSSIFGVSVIEIWRAEPPVGGDNGVTITDEGDQGSGTWASPGNAIDYVTVSWGDLSYLVQKYFDSPNGSAFSGLWSSYDTSGNSMEQKQALFVTFYKQAPVPIPSSIILFSAGLIGLIGWRVRSSRIT